MTRRSTTRICSADRRQFRKLGRTDLADKAAQADTLQARQKAEDERRRPSSEDDGGVQGEREGEDGGKAGTTEKAPRLRTRPRREEAGRRIVLPNDRRCLL